MPFESRSNPVASSLTRPKIPPFCKQPSTPAFCFPTAARDGACGSLQGRILEGSVDYGKVSPTTLTDTDKRPAGIVLLRQTALGPRAGKQSRYAQQRHPGQEASCRCRDSKGGQRCRDPRTQAAGQ